MFYSIALFVFVVVCLLLITIILLQSSQSGGMGSIGGGNNFLDGALGSQGADALLLRTTTILAVIFMTLAIMINLLDNPASNMNFSTEPVLMKNNTGEIIPGTDVLNNESQVADPEVGKIESLPSTSDDNKVSPLTE
tara:strand:+ start:617 stop:1027 length:411 start_codon:yes stop_codon:yes gene_type:complete